MPRPPRPEPKEGAEDSWPGARMTDPVHEAHRRFVLNLTDALEGLSFRKAAELTGVDRGTLRAIVEGRSWVDAYALAKLEQAFQRTLWPGYIDD